MLFTVVIPLYNKQGQVARALEAVLAQTFTDFDVVIVDDGSTDGSAAEAAAVIAAHPDRDMRLLRQPNGGVSAARNRGISAARGEYIAFLDADDEWKPGFLATIAGMIEAYPDCRVFATNYEFRNAQGHVTPTIMRHMHIDGVSGPLDNYFQVASNSHSPITSSSVAIDRKALDAIGGFPVGVASGEDLLTWARLACRHRIAFAKATLAVYNVAGYVITSKPKRIPPKEDVAGKAIHELMNSYNTPYLKRYVSFWHKMKASVYMRAGRRCDSMEECLKGIRYWPGNIKLYAYILINLLPFKIVK